MTESSGVPSAPATDFVGSSVRARLYVLRARVLQVAAAAGILRRRTPSVWERRAEHRACWETAANAIGAVAAKWRPHCLVRLVIANAYPMDLSATFVRSKGMIPLAHAAAGASRVLIGAASEGMGNHGLRGCVGDISRGRCLVDRGRGDVGPRINDCWHEIWEEAIDAMQ
jgi:hypothetical protein